MSFEWQVPLIVIGIVVGIYFFVGRPKADADLEAVPEAEPEQEREVTGRPSSAELIEGLQETLGIAIVVESVESVESSGAVTIQATFMFGSHTTPATVTGETEAEAWEELAKSAIAWRNADYQHIRMWGAGG